MDFERVLQELLDGLNHNRIRYATIGGFALGVLGVPRTTMDLDFLVHRDDLNPLHALLTDLGYDRAVQSENVSHYRHRDVAWGGVDIIHAFRPHSIAMLGRAGERRILNGAKVIRVAEPEDVIGLKVQAMANDPRREAQEIADIESLARRHGGSLDWARVEEYYRIFGLEAEGRALRSRFEHAE
jgi:hypothetical protein